MISFGNQPRGVPLEEKSQVINKIWADLTKKNNIKY